VQRRRGFRHLALILGAFSSCIASKLLTANDVVEMGKALVDV
jgi:hypothetical protein